jgi:hypothetical protein
MANTSLKPTQLLACCNFWLVLVSIPSLAIPYLHRPLIQNFEKNSKIKTKIKNQPKIKTRTKIDN